MKKVIIFIVFAFCMQTLQAQWCNQPDPDFCPNNIIQNGDFENITSNPNAAWQRDVNAATGWERAWASSTSLADLWCSNGTSYFNPPTPNTGGTYAGMWIINASTTMTAGPPFYREVLYNKLNASLPKNTTTYSLNFDIANAQKFGNNGSVEIGIYGVYNPSNIIEPISPVGINANPTNINLWQSPSSASVQVVLLGTITTPPTFTNQWLNQTISFSASGFPTNGITHLLITSYDQARTPNFRRHYVNFDNFCIEQTNPPPPVPTIDSLYCCQEHSPNLIPNGNFEAGNVGFTSQYNHGSIMPEGYVVTDFTTANTFCDNWVVEDHTHCAIGVNQNILFVNGQTQQGTNANNTIWQMANLVDLQGPGEYKFCASVQHLPNCCYDIVPEIRVEGRFLSGSAWFPIVNWTTLTSSDPGDPCDWEELTGTIYASPGSAIEIRIVINEKVNGDGNDLALDDISLIKKAPQNVLFSLLSQPISTSTTQYTLDASINSISPADDVLADPSCKYFWVVGGAGSPWRFGTSPNWGLTTNFSGYPGAAASSPAGVFNYRQSYTVYLGVYDCDCHENDWTYQTLYSHGRSSGLTTSPMYKLKDLPKSQQKALKGQLEQIKKGQSINSSIQDIFPDNSLDINTEKENSKTSVEVMPNPFMDYLTINITLPQASEVSIELSNVEGKILTHKALGRLPKGAYAEELNIQDLALNNGLYFITVKTANEIVTKKVVRIE